jgi:AraC-like DNA-binding protein
MSTQKSTQKLEYPRNEKQRTILRPGLELIVQDFMPKEDLVVNLEMEHLLEFCLCLSGKIQGNIQGLKNEFSLDADQAAFWFNPKSGITMQYSAGQSVQWVGIRVKPQLFGTLIESQPEWLPADLSRVVMGSENRFYYHIGEMTALMRIAAHQVLNCPYQGFTRRIYLEGKILELLAYLIVAFHPENLSILRPEERQRVLRARTILIDNFKQPPSLLELSHKVGLNDYKLKIGFRQVFGTTVFGYLREHRMEYARQLLEKGEMSVTEVSYSVGYCSLSHFAKAFSRQFGTKPGFYLSKMRKKAYMSPSHHQNPSCVSLDKG